ncbi:MAG TPA: Ig-like domain-containing protein [Gammaproteobacteria bacterium]|nr:Ig-like domain-containing protein [Gammaproteobacteria bacterium]
MRTRRFWSVVSLASILLFLVGFASAAQAADPITLVISAPAAGTVSGKITVSADVTDPSGLTPTVQFFLDNIGGFTIGSPITQPPYQMTWDSGTVPNGQHEILAEATDSAGNTNTTLPLSDVIVEVSNNIPVIQYISPGSGATGTVTAAAHVTDDVAPVTHVEFLYQVSDFYFRNSTPLLTLASFDSPPYQTLWDTTTLQNREYVFAIQATDAAGNTATSPLFGLSISNFPGIFNPTIVLETPANGATVSGTVPLTATAADSGATVTSVQFMLDGADLGPPITQPPYTFNWDSIAVPNGIHDILAIANNNLGGFGLSLLSEVTVSNTVTTPPPTVSITAPAAGATLSGTVTVSADASESGGTIASVQFFWDGTPLGAAVTSAPYQVSWDTTAAANGSNSLTAVATNDSGQTTTSAPVTVTVANNPAFVPPTVSMTAPADGTTVSGSVTLSAGADDAVGTVTFVQFLLDGNHLGAVVTAAPYQMSWDSTTVPNGSHTLAALAFNNDGQSTTSAPVTVTVSNSVTPPPPTVSITTPADGATLTGSVTVAANAADTGGQVTSVQFLLDGTPLGALVTAAPYQVSWDTTTVPNGSHVLTAVATNDASETTTSAAVTATVANVTLPPPPTVAITTLANGVMVSGRVKLKASAADSGGTVTQVQYFLNGSALSPVLTQAPYKFVWKTRAVPNGSVTLTAVATNDSGETTTSAPVMVTVRNPGRLRDCVWEGACLAPVTMGREMPATLRLISPP